MMTFDQFKILIKGLKAVYTSPNFLPDADSVKIWYSLLKDLDYESANVAIQKHILVSKFPPTIADIREQAVTVTIGDKPTWSDGWEEVLRAIRKFGMYREREALDSMTEITRKAVQRLGFKEICMSENLMADRANFRMIFETMADREQANKQIPVSISRLIGEIQKKQNLLEAKEVEE